MGITILATVAGVSIEVSLPLVIKSAVDLATGHRTTGPSISTVAAIIAALAVARYGCTFTRRLIAGRIAVDVQHRLRTAILDTLFRLDGRAQDSIITGQIVSRSITDLQLVQGLLSLVPLSFGAAAQIVVSLVVMVFLSPVLTLVALVVVPTVAATATVMRKRLFAATWSAQQAAGDVAQHVEETVTGVRVVKGFGQERRSVDELIGWGSVLFAKRMRSTRINAVFTPTMNAAPQLGLVAVIAVGGVLTANGTVSVGTYLAFATYVSTMAGLVRILSNLVVSGQLARAAVERVYEVIDHPRDRLLSASRRIPAGPVGVRLRDVGFTFPDPSPRSDPDAAPGEPSRTPVFDGLDLRVAPGECVALIGAPGSGKTTLAALLSGFYQADRGSIEFTSDIDRDADVAIDEVSRESLRERVGVVLDDPFLYSDTVAANIAVGADRGRLDDPDVRTRIVEAARAAQAERFVGELADGFDTVVGERGLTLSGGQRQRIALARALFADPSVLILDDATSAVDATTEGQILSRLRARGDRTMIVLAHRRSTLTLADRVAVIDGGRVVADGTVEHLDAHSALFRSLMTRPEVAAGSPDASGSGKTGSGAPSTGDDPVVDLDRLWPPTEQLDAPAPAPTPAPAPAPAPARFRASSTSTTRPTPRRRGGGGGIAGGLGSMAPTPELLAAVDALPPADEDPKVDVDAARAPDPIFSLPRMLAPVRALLVVALLAVALDTLTSLGFPTVARAVVNAATSDDLTSMWWACAAGVVLVGLGWLALAVVTLASGRAGERVLFALRVRSYAHLQRLGLDYFERELSGRIMTRMTTDIDALATFLQTGLTTAIVSVLTIVGVAIALVATDVTLGASLLIIFPVLFVATGVFQQYSSRAYARSRELISAVNADFQENVNGLRTTLGYRNDELARRRFAERSLDYARSRIASQRAIATYFPFIMLMSDLATAAVVGIGAHQVAQGTTSPGTLIAFTLYLGMLFGPIQQLSQVFDGYQQAAVGLRRIGDLLRTPSSLAPDREFDEDDGHLRERGDAVAVPAHFRGHAQLDDVTFRYQSAAGDALRNVSLDIPAGTSLALVGETGAGKSTIVKLLARFYDPTAGAVRMDGVDIRRHRLHDYRARLGVVPQEPHLFTGTVADNIAYGRPDASRAEIARAAAAVGAADMIAGLRGAMRHPIGERGRGLSAGQRQLIALARAELVEPDLLLLDEATATLDQATEHQVLEAGAHLTRARTSVIVAHRLATAARADRIAVVADGRIVESGTHPELLALNGRYRRLWDSGLTRLDDVELDHPLDGADAVGAR
ncbi:ABC transporter ATP-binding protein [Williamsia sp. CHRR-6]|uniref:ABC transporter ATP-binding protein n=1 Tax=Williamsia sp. CHRR-6 TaxID=2835871 RepID=UPI0035B02114